MKIKFRKNVCNNLYVTDKNAVVVATGRVRTEFDKEKQKPVLRYIEAAPKDNPKDAQFYSKGRLKCCGKTQAQSTFSSLSELL